MNVRGKRVMVGLSGGVDSAVTAAILKEAGAHVTGVFVKGWYPEGLPCTWSEDRRDAMRVAARLGIPFHTLDAAEEYKRAVIDYLIREYGAGRTPNPDVFCNREVKFGALYRFAKSHGADSLATGHYARTHGGHLLRGVDHLKDQSYFLWAIEPEVVQSLLFPLGNMRKSEVRDLAQAFNLPNASKRDSQGICFLGPVSIEDFLEHELTLTPGTAQDIAGQNIGTHAGALRYTLGERVQLTTPHPGPWYVIRKDVERNSITVAHEPLAEVPIKTFQLESINILGALAPGARYTAQYRYHGPMVTGVWTGSGFILDHPIMEPIAAGQSLVIYDGEKLMGGGIIAACVSGLA